MALTPEEIASLKSQLYSQIDSLPPDKKAQAKKQIDEMSAETLEYLLKQSQASSKKEKNIFRMIIDKEIDSVEVGENKYAVGVLDINPVSLGHTLIIPKIPVKDPKSLPNACFTLAKAISKKITRFLKPKNTEIHSENKFGECILHIIPIYDAQVHLGSPRQKLERDELDKIASKIRIKKRQRILKIKKQAVSTQSQIAKRRIP